MSFNVETHGEYTLVHCPGDMGNAALKDFETMMKGWLEKPSKCTVFNFSNVTVFNSAFYRPFVTLSQGVKKKGCFVTTIRCRDEIIAQFRANGLEGVFNVKSELADALEFAGLPKPAPPPPKRSTMNVQFINPFINATQLTLERQAKTKLTAGKPFARTDQAAVQDFEIAGVINLASNVFQGSIALCFPEKVFIAIYANMVGEKHPRITQEMEDSASELLNIIFGMAKAELDSVGMKIEKAIPTVVRGSQLRVFQANRAVAIILPFQTDAGPFHVEIGVNPI